MESNNDLKDKSKDLEISRENNVFKNLKSNYFLQKIFDNIQKRKSLEIIEYNKQIQNRLNLSIKNYKEYSEIYTPIEIEIILSKNKYGKFVNINKNEEFYYHIYFNDNKEEIKNKYEINKNEKISNIKIVIDYQVKSFEKLFFRCMCIESINFKKFYRNNITSMSEMFSECSSLKELNLSTFNTNNVIKMNYMFNECSSLKEINLSKFNTSKVKKMIGMFARCSSLKELNLSNFNTYNVTNMTEMFYNCFSLNELNLSSFNTSNVTSMDSMFRECSALKELDLSCFNTNKVKNMSFMFFGCSNELKMKVISENPNIKINF